MPHDRWALFATVVRALENFRHKDDWRKLQVRGMTADFSWSASAIKYIDLYRHALAVRDKRPKPEELDANET